MVERVLGSAYLTEIDAMIGRAEAACERYRQAALEEGLSPAIVARRRSASQTMKDMLARLRAHRGRQRPGASSGLEEKRAAETA